MRSDRYDIGRLITGSICGTIPNWNDNDNAHRTHFFTCLDSIQRQVRFVISLFYHLLYIFWSMTPSSSSWLGAWTTRSGPSAPSSAPSNSLSGSKTESNKKWETVLDWIWIRPSAWLWLCWHRHVISSIILFLLLMSSSYFSSTPFLPASERDEDYGAFDNVSFTIELVKWGIAMSISYYLTQVNIFAPLQ